jgi:glutamate formiminotransferase/formiminotetrahydrofolate cyclodeaminase
MVSRLSLNRPKYEAYQATNERSLAAAEEARGGLLALANEDTVAYGRFAAARKLPRETDDEQRARTVAMQDAARAASDVPMNVLRACQTLLVEVGASAGRSNLNAASDLEVAGRLAAAAAQGAAANVKINLPMVGDAAYAGAVTAELEGILSDVNRTLAQVVERVGTGELREPERE